MAFSQASQSYHLCMRGFWHAQVIPAQRHPSRSAGPAQSPTASRTAHPVSQLNPATHNQMKWSFGLVTVPSAAIARKCLKYSVIVLVTVSLTLQASLDLQAFFSRSVFTDTLFTLGKPGTKKSRCVICTYRCNCFRGPVLEPVSLSCAQKLSGGILCVDSMSLP